MPWGHKQAAWNSTKKHAKTLLAECARRRLNQTISYSDLGARLRPISFLAEDPAFHALLGEVSEEEDGEGRGMLSVLVVHKDGDMRPGRGFYDLASSLGRYVGDEEVFWVKELRRVITAWTDGGTTPPPSKPPLKQFGSGVFRVRGGD